MYYIWTMQLQTLQFKIGVKVPCIINKSPMVGEHAFPLTEIDSCMALSHNSIREQQLCSIKSMRFSFNSLQV